VKKANKAKPDQIKPLQFKMGFILSAIDTVDTIDAVTFKKIIWMPGVP